MSQETKSAESDAPFRKWISRICVVGILAWAGYFFAFLVYGDADRPAARA